MCWIPVRDGKGVGSSQRGSKLYRQSPVQMFSNDNILSHLKIQVPLFIENTQICIGEGKSQDIKPGETLFSEVVGLGYRYSLVSYMGSDFIDSF